MQKNSMEPMNKTELIFWVFSSQPWRLAHNENKHSAVKYLQQPISNEAITTLSQEEKPSGLKHYN